MIAPPPLHAFADDLVGEFISDEELEALALGSEQEPELAPDAIALSVYLGQHLSPLPQWYMPPAVARGLRGWRLVMVVVIVAAFLTIDALGLCGTYGQIVLA